MASAEVLNPFTPRLLPAVAGAGEYAVIADYTPDLSLPTLKNLKIGEWLEIIYNTEPVQLFLMKYSEMKFPRQRDRYITELHTRVKELIIGEVEGYFQQIIRCLKEENFAEAADTIFKAKKTILKIGIGFNRGLKSNLFKSTTEEEINLVKTLEMVMDLFGSLLLLEIGEPEEALNKIADVISTKHFSTRLDHIANGVNPNEIIDFINIRGLKKYFDCVIDKASMHELTFENLKVSTTYQVEQYIKAVTSWNSDTPEKIMLAKRAKIECLKKLIKVAPTIEGLAKVGIALFQQGDTSSLHNISDIICNTKISEEMSDTDIISHIFILEADTLLKEGNYDKGEKVLVEGINLFPNNEEIQELLITALYRLEKYSEVTRYLKIFPKEICKTYRIEEIYKQKYFADGFSLDDFIKKNTSLKDLISIEVERVKKEEIEGIDLDMLQKAIGRFYSNLRDNNGNTALDTAIYYKKMQIFKEIVKEYGTDINRQSKITKNTALHTALTYSEEEAYLKLADDLISEPSINLLVANIDGTNILHYLASSGNIALISKALEKVSKDKLNIQDKFGLTPLHYAAKSAADYPMAAEKIKKLLIEYGADINKISKAGETAEQLFEEFGKYYDFYSPYPDSDDDVVLTGHIVSNDE